MDAVEALLALDEELSRNPSAETTPTDLERCSDAVAIAATVPEGYSKAAWKHGVTLLKVAERASLDPVHFFDSFGWRALANGLRAGIENKQILKALSFVDESFLPPDNSQPLFEHPLVVQAVREGLKVTPHPFVNPSELAAASKSLQMQFGKLLNVLIKLHADVELRLQWSACALRVIPIHIAAHREAATSLLYALIDDQRYVTAYYAFRALTEQHDDLWAEPIVPKLLRSFIEQCLHRGVNGHEALVELCSDDEVLRKCNEQISLLTLIGTLSIYLTYHRGYQEAENTAWLFINELHSIHNLVAYALSNYLTSGLLPELPMRRAHEVEQIKEMLAEMIETAERELRPRTYDKVPLAIKIYQFNVHEVFLPILRRVQSGHLPAGYVEQIRQIDPKDLVTECELQKTNRFPIEGKLLRKMVADNKKILQTLESAAKTRIELDELLSAIPSESAEQFGVFQESQAMLDDFDQTLKWALDTLLPDFWKRLQTGIGIVQQEEAILHAAR